MLYAETIGNPLNNVLDIAAVADVAHDAGLPLVIDSTFATPYLCRPIEHGADIVVHSVTKWIGGHGTSIGGALIESGKFPWDNGNFPGMTEPSKGYHGIRFYETFGDFGFTMKARAVALRDFGPSMSPANAFYTITAIESLSERMDRHAANAEAVAKLLEAHPSVAWVSYAGLKSSRYHNLAKKYLPKGAGSLFTFGLNGGYDAGIKLVESVNLFSHLANIGDTRSLILHPASTTHRQLTDEQRKAAGAGPDVIRLSVGLESVDDLIDDLECALAA